MRSICEKCSNTPCRENDTTLPDSHYLIADQFKKKFDFDENRKTIIVECTGYNKKDFFYTKEYKKGNEK